MLGLFAPDEDQLVCIKWMNPFDPINKKKNDSNFGFQKALVKVGILVQLVYIFVSASFYALALFTTGDSDKLSWTVTILNYLASFYLIIGLIGIVRESRPLVHIFLWFATVLWCLEAFCLVLTACVQFSGSLSNAKEMGKFLKETAELEARFERRSDVLAVMYKLLGLINRNTSLLFENGQRMNQLSIVCTGVELISIGIVHLFMWRIGRTIQLREQNFAILSSAKIVV